jgi:ribosomal protein L40E
MSSFEPTKQTTFCRRCNAEMEPDAVLCTKCGTYVKSAVNAKTKERMKGAGRLGLGIIVSSAVAALGGVVWAMIAIHGEVELGFLAWGIGFVTGGAMLACVREPSFDTGMIAAGIAVCGILLAKLIMFSGVVPDVSGEFLRDPDALAVVQRLRMAENDDFEADVCQAIMAEFDSDGIMEHPAEVQTKLDAAMVTAAEKVNVMTQAQKKDLAQWGVDRVLGEIGLGERIKMFLSPIDGLWFILAMFSAWKLGSGVGSG